ncbi:MAG: SUMF1/EgtB/PvdO family nonheme iron enzyme [Spirochaetota bacterium]
METEAPFPHNHFSGAGAGAASPYLGFDPINWDVDMVELEATDYLFQDRYPLHIPAFRIARFQVTRQFYHIVMRLPSPRNPYQPMVGISWFDALRFANRLSSLSGLEPAYHIRKLRYETGNPPRTELRYEVEWSAENGSYRLPTEAEWEYAARGGARSRYFLYSGSNTADHVAWHEGNSVKLQAVGQKEPNEIGLYDMSGNAWDWLWDRFIPLKYSILAGGPSAAPVLGPEALKNRPEKMIWHGPGIREAYLGASRYRQAIDFKAEKENVRTGVTSPELAGELRTCRGGAWNFAKIFSEVRRRSSCLAEADYYVSVGFRLVRGIPEKPSVR